jgi:aminoglycoside phosphotransferase (APT) family kinase protein
MSAEVLRDGLERRLAHLPIGSCAVSELKQLTGGASRETWMFTATDGNGVGHELVLRRDPPGAEDPARMTLEATALTEAAAARVPVPELLDRSGGRPIEGIGGAYLLMEKLPGEALPQRLLRDERFTQVRTRLPQELGRVLARIHQMNTHALPGLSGGDQLEQLFTSYLETGLRLPVLEVAFQWLRAHRPDSDRETVVHGDFRNGNVLVDETSIRAVLDWELVHRGDPMEDLGWLCMKTWRFGAPGPVGGFGSREDLFRGYHDECGISPDPESVHWWEFYSTLRWAVMCRFQANRALVHGEGNALELLAIGRKVAECEHDLLVMLGLGDDTAAANPAHVGQTDPDDLFGRPSAGELLAAVQTFVRERCSDGDPQSKYLGRVACSALDVAAREINLGDQRRAAHRDALAAIGFATEAELALALRTGKCSVSDPAVAQSVRQAVAARLSVAHPGYVNRLG